MESYWESSDKPQKTSPDQIIKMLKKNGADPDIAAEVANQISLVDEDNNNIIFIFTDDNQYVVTGIHVPSESLDGNHGPVLMRGGNDKSIIAAFSRDFVAERLDSVDSAEEKAGLPGVSEVLWVEELEKLAEMVRVELRTNPPEKWEDLLMGE